MEATTYRNQYSEKNTENWRTLDLRSHGYAAEFASIGEAHRTLRLVADPIRYDYRLVVVRNGQIEVI